MLPDFADGAWLVELASLANAAHLLPALAATFDLHETPGRPPASVVMDYLRAKTLLLIFWTTANTSSKPAPAHQ